MADLIRLIFMIALLGTGLIGLVFMPMCAIGFANMSGGSPGFWAYVIWFAVSLPALGACVGLILWARKLYRDW